MASHALLGLDEMKLIARALQVEAGAHGVSLVAFSTADEAMRKGCNSSLSTGAVCEQR